MNRSRRTSARVDYKKLHTQGRQNCNFCEKSQNCDHPASSETNMSDEMSDNDILKNSEKELCEELDDFVICNEDQGLTDIGFIDEYKSKLYEFLVKFKSTHRDLKLALGQEEYDHLYPDFSDKAQAMLTRIKEVNSKRAELREEDRKRVELEQQERREEREERVERQKRELEAQEARDTWEKAAREKEILAATKSNQ